MTESRPIVQSRSSMYHSGVPLSDPIATHAKPGRNQTTLAVLHTIARFSVNDVFDVRDVCREMAKLPDSFPIKGLPTSMVAGALLRILAEEPSCLQAATIPRHGVLTKYRRTLDPAAVEAAKATIAVTTQKPKQEPAPAAEGDPGANKLLLNLLAKLTYELGAMREENREMAVKMNRILDELGVKA